MRRTLTTLEQVPTELHTQLDRLLDATHYVGLDPSFHGKGLAGMIDRGNAQEWLDQVYRNSLQICLADREEAVEFFHVSADGYDLCQQLVTTLQALYTHLGWPTP